MRPARAYPNLSPRPNSHARRVADACANLNSHVAPDRNPNARAFPRARFRSCLVPYANSGSCARRDARANPNPRRPNADGAPRPRGDPRAAPDRNADAYSRANAYARLRSGRRRRRGIHV